MQEAFQGAHRELGAGREAFISESASAARLRADGVLGEAVGHRKPTR